MCDYHVLAYKIECHNRAEQAEDLIHPELGRGHTNQLESANSALIRFRRKNWNLQRTHYHVSTKVCTTELRLLDVENREEFTHKKILLRDL